MKIAVAAESDAGEPQVAATPETIKDWSLSSLKEKLIKIGAKVISHGRSVAFQMSEVAITRQMFQEILRLIAELLPKPPRCSCVREHLTGVLLPDGKENRSNRAPGVTFGNPTEGDGQESRQTLIKADLPDR